jgi:hypothetical protein
MHPRIRELADQALKECDAAKERGIDQYSKRFAELIVRACADVLHQDVDIMPELGGYAHDMVVNMGFKYE